MYNKAMFTDPVKNLESFGLEPNMKIADLGAGSGSYVLEAAKHIGEGRVYAVEVQKELLAKIKNDADREGLSNIEYVWGDIEEHNGTRIGDSVVDSVFISNTLFQVENKETTLHEAFRILKSKGRLLVIDWTDSFGGLGPTEKSVFSKEKAKDLCEKTGFVFEREFDPGSHHYALIYRKP